MNANYIKCDYKGDGDYYTHSNGKYNCHIISPCVHVKKLIVFNHNIPVERIDHHEQKQIQK